MLTRIDPATVTLRPASLLEAWLVALESDEFTQVRKKIRGKGGRGRCVWGVLYVVMERAGLTEQEQRAFIGEVRAIDHAAASQLGWSSIADANDDGVSFAAIAGALRQARAELDWDAVEREG